MTKTIAEIEILLQLHGAEATMREYESGHIKAIAFKHEGISFQLPARVEALYQYLIQARQQRPGFVDQAMKIRLHDQAERCAWRNVMYWIKAQLAIVEIGMVTVTEVFLPYMLVGGNETLYDRMLTRGLTALPKFTSN